MNDKLENVEPVEGASKFPLRVPVSLTKLEKVASVFLIITNSSGDVRGIFGGTNSVLPTLLKHYAAEISEDTPSRPVRLIPDIIMPLGQDVYAVTREFVLHVRAAMTFLPWADLHTLDKQLPSGLIYHFVVSY